MHGQISKLTRFLQDRYPLGPLPGIYRFALLMQKFLPRYRGTIQLSQGFKINIDTENTLECVLLYTGKYQPALTKFLEKHKVANGYYLDVGGNVGYFSLLFATWAGNYGKVGVFEANPYLVSHINNLLQLNEYANTSIISKAVDMTSGQDLKFYISNSNGKSSIHAQLSPNLKEVIHTETISIDQFMEDSQWKRLDIIKMDIEGNDCQAILGATKTIQKHKPLIVFEFKSITPIPIRKKTAELLEKVGYKLETLMINGTRQKFDWQIPKNLPNVDVICYPPTIK